MAPDPGGRGWRGVPCEIPPCARIVLILGGVLGCCAGAGLGGMLRIPAVGSDRTVCPASSCL